MKVLIIGVGRLGSTIAWEVCKEINPEKVMLYDIKDLSGDMLDLKHACKGYGINTTITDKREKADIIIISAGHPRINMDDNLFDKNFPIIEDAYRIIKQVLKTDTKIIVMTNPVIDMTEIMRKLLPNHMVECPEKILNEMRRGKELGWDIIKTKGYTNFGAAVSCVKLIKKLEGLK